MSNALYMDWLGAALAQTPASAPADKADLLGPATAGADPAMLGLVAIGVVVLGVWIIRCFARPRRLLLLNTPARPNRLNIIHIVVVFLAMQVAMALATEALRGVLAEPATATQPAATAPAGPASEAEPDPRLGQAAGMLASLTWLAAGLAVAHVTFRHRLVRGLGLSMRHWMCDSARGVVGYFAILPVCVGLFVLSRSISEWLGFPLRIHPVLVHFGGQELGWQIVAAVNAVVLAPLAEEVFFRGLLQSLLRRVLHGPRAAIVATSIFFALIHAPAEPQAVPSLFALSLAMGYNYERTGRLVSPIVIHAIFNAVALLLTT